jgi:transposase-like protein
MAIANHSNEAKGAKEPRNGNTKRRKRNRPPLPGDFSTKNSHTSAKRIALRRRQSEALKLREQGYNYEQIAKYMTTNPSTVYRWVRRAGSLRAATQNATQTPRRPTMTIGTDGAGKSTLSIAEAISMVTGRDLLGEMPEERCKVWLHNADDDRTEMYRRRAAVLYSLG